MLRPRAFKMNKKQKLELQKLQKQWYKKLEKQGFKDIETEDGFLKDWDSYRFLKLSPEWFYSKQEFYAMAGRFLHDRKFYLSSHHLIWQLFSEGKSVSYIAKKTDISEYTVSKIIKIYTNEMLAGLKNEK